MTGRERPEYRRGGTVSVPGVYGGWIDKVPMGSVMNRGLTIRTGQTHVQRYLRPLLARIERGDIAPTFMITRHMQLDQAPEAHQMFRYNIVECVKVVLHP